MSNESCGRCGVQNVPLKRCKECESILYCSVDCQKNDWKKHKRVCKKDCIVFISGKVRDKSGNEQDFGHEFPMTRAQLELFKVNPMAGQAFVNDKIHTVIEPDVLPRNAWVCGIKEDPCSPCCHNPVRHIVTCSCICWPRNGSGKIMNALAPIAIPTCSQHKQYHTEFVELCAKASSDVAAELEAQAH